MYSSLRRTETCLETGNSEAKAAADSILVESCKILSAGCINPPHPGLPLDHHPHPAAASIVDSASPVRSPHPRRQSVAYATSRNWIRSSPSISTTVPFAPHRKLPASPLIVAGCCRRGIKETIPH
uniref:Uncharacterized protein n=1 Tax=Oryza rufipogon TaxID=4529 RepID=A0A0E0P1G2_ORYRU